MRLLDEQGFEPEAEGNELHMRRCPFHDLAEQHPQVVCAAHRGLISGALEELGSELRGSELDVFVGPISASRGSAHPGLTPLSAP